MAGGDALGPEDVGIDQAGLNAVEETSAGLVEDVQGHLSQIGS